MQMASMRRNKCLMQLCELENASNSHVYEVALFFFPVKVLKKVVLMMIMVFPILLYMCLMRQKKVSCYKVTIKLHFRHYL